MADPTPRRAVLPFLDGLRGLAALYVTFHHAAILVPPAELGRRALGWVSYFYMGHAAVSVFIVLSGYCLMLPVVRSADGGLRGGLAAYLRRRAARILPPYYAALALCLLLVALIPALRHRSQTSWDLALPVLRLDGVLAHVFLVHNLRMRWFYRIDPPMWSVATEWQIYFLFPALLVLWRRWGIGAVVGAAFLLGFGVTLIPLGLGGTPASWALWRLCPWYLGLFALGMGAAVVGFSADRRARWARARLPWGLLTAGLAVVSFIRETRYGGALPANDVVNGLATACLLVFCEIHDRAESAGGRPPILRLLGSRWAVSLGSFSYSLYLLNYPLLALAYLAAGRRWASAEGRLAVSMLAAVPLTVALAYAFGLVFERRRGGPHGAQRADLPDRLVHAAHGAAGLRGRRAAVGKRTQS